MEAITRFAVTFLVIHSVHGVIVKEPHLLEPTEKPKETHKRELSDKGTEYSLLHISTHNGHRLDLQQPPPTAQPQLEFQQSEYLKPEPESQRLPAPIEESEYDSQKASPLNYIQVKPELHFVPVQMMSEFLQRHHHAVPLSYQPNVQDNHYGLHQTENLKFNRPTSLEMQQKLHQIYENLIHRQHESLNINFQQQQQNQLEQHIRQNIKHHTDQRQLEDQNKFHKHVDLQLEEHIKQLQQLNIQQHLQNQLQERIHQNNLQQHVEQLQQNKHQNLQQDFQKDLQASIIQQLQKNSFKQQNKIQLQNTYQPLHQGILHQSLENDLREKIHQQLHQNNHQQQTGQQLKEYMSQEHNEQRIQNKLQENIQKQLQQKNWQQQFGQQLQENIQHQLQENLYHHLQRGLQEQIRHNVQVVPLQQQEHQKLAQSQDEPFLQNYIRLQELSANYHNPAEQKLQLKPYYYDHNTPKNPLINKEFISYQQPQNQNVHQIQPSDGRQNNEKLSTEKPKIVKDLLSAQVRQHYDLMQYAPSFLPKVQQADLSKLKELIENDKAKANARAEAIVNSPPEVVHRHISITRHRPIHIDRHVAVPVPTPIAIPIPQPIEIPVPQPFAVPVEVIRPFAVPITQTHAVAVDKPVPYEVEKLVPVAVEKKVYVKVDRHIPVDRLVPVEVRKEIPVEIPIKKPESLHIVRHVWEKSGLW